MKATETVPLRVTARDRLLQAFERRGGQLTRQDVRLTGISPRTLYQLLEAGTVVRAAQGLYRLADVMPVGEAAFAQACLAVPSGVVALASALSYHELTTQIVDAVDLAVPKNVHRRRLEMPVRLVPMPAHRLIGPSIERHGRSGEEAFQITNAERSVVDAFAYPKEVPEAVAYEALRAYIERRPNFSELNREAEEAGVIDIIGPVLRTLHG